MVNNFSQNNICIQLTIVLELNNLPESDYKLVMSYIFAKIQFFITRLDELLEVVCFIFFCVLFCTVCCVRYTSCAPRPLIESIHLFYGGYSIRRGQEGPSRIDGGDRRTVQQVECCCSGAYSSIGLSTQHQQKHQRRCIVPLSVCVYNVALREFQMSQPDRTTKREKKGESNKHAAGKEKEQS